MNLKEYRSDVILIIHFVLGMLLALASGLAFLWGILVFLIGIIAAYNNTKQYPPHFFAAYLVGLELLARMSSSGLPHEFIKYAVSAVLLLSIVRTSRKINYAFVVIMLLLIPSCFLTDGGNLEETRQLISGNLSGLLCLVISALYFYNRPFTPDAIKKIFRAILFPLSSILGYMVVETPDFSEVDFGFQSNFVTSVYGPNQISSILGLGVLLIGLGYFLKIKFFKSNVVTIAFFSFLLFRGLLTFSRGGMITPVVLLIFIFIYFSWKVAGFNKSTIRIVLISSFLAAIFFFVFNYTDELTGDKLSDRYTGQRGGVQVENIDNFTSGRTKIMVLDWQIFLDNPWTGIGVGMGKFERVKYGYGVEVAAHNEFTRMLAEHGIFGVLALLLLIGLPIVHFYGRNRIAEKSIVIAFIGFCFVFMTHAATRIAAPSFLYGFAFISIPFLKRSVKHNVTLSRKQTFKTREGSFGNRTVGA
ncbi:MAG: O-antigen ligase family protein [Cyclobacteriaceae bacterium]